MFISLLFFSHVYAESVRVNRPYAKVYELNSIFQGQTPIVACSLPRGTQVVSYSLFRGYYRVDISTSPYCSMNYGFVRQQDVELVSSGSQLSSSSPSSDSTTEGRVEDCIDCHSRSTPIRETTQEAIQQVVKTSDRLSITQRVEEYSNSSEVKDAIIYGMSKRQSASTRYCYRHVKQMLQKGNFVDKYLPGKSAKFAGPELEEHGFTNLLNVAPYNTDIKSPYDAPKGAVLVYSGGRHGHIEMKTNDGFLSDYFSTRARTGSVERGMEGPTRKLTGVYVKI